MLAVDILGTGEARYCPILETRKGDKAEAGLLMLVASDFSEFSEDVEALSGTSAVDLFTTCRLDSDVLDAPLGTLTSETMERVLRDMTKLNVEAHYRHVHKPRQNQPFVPGESRVPYAGRVYDEQELLNLTDSALDFWLTAGPYHEKFQRAFAEIIGVKYCAVVNSGSSANLCAFMALTSPKLNERRVQPGDEVITVAAGFPTTVNPIIQYGAVPVFVDVDARTANIDVAQLKAALSPRTRVVMLAHTLGNPFDIAAVKAFCDKHELWLVEDNCDALGSTYQGQPTGSFGDIATSSFYPPHHLTMGEGGAVYTSNSRLKVTMESFRDWGRDCYCDSGKDNTCKKRFGWELGTLPKGYDHKYIYSHFGYNLKATDMQAAIGLAQLDKLEGFTARRRANWSRLRESLAGLQDRLALPEATEGSEPSWFGFLMRVRKGSGVGRDEIVGKLEAAGIQTRMLFAGNYLRHPAFDEMRESGKGHRVVGPLTATDDIMQNAFWVGVYPGMTDAMLDYMSEQIIACFE